MKPNQVAHVDNLAFMAGLPDACCDLIYADPPFYTGKHHAQASRSTIVADRWPAGIDEYLAFLRPRLERMHRLLKPTATVYVHLDWHAVHYVKVLMDEIFGYNHFLNEIVWAYRTGGRGTRHFARKHDTILVYAREVGRHKFNLQREGAFRTDGLNRDDTGRPYKNTRAGRLYFHPEGPALTDVWDLPFLSTVSRERLGYPTQKPEALLERIIRASTDPGDLVADFFCGSGTTLAVAKRLGRNWFGCDLAPEAVHITQDRLDQISPDAANAPSPVTKRRRSKHT